MPYKSDKDDFTNTTILLWAVVGIIFLILLLIMNISSKDTDSTWTVIYSDGTKYSNLTKRLFNEDDFITKEGKTIGFTGNHITIEE